MHDFSVICWTFSICLNWPMTCIKWPMTLVVARHRQFSFVDYQNENGHSIVDLSNIWLLKPLTHNTTWFFGSLIITKYDFNTKPLTHEYVKKRNWFMKYVGYLDFDEFFVEVGVNRIGSSSKQMECDMIYQLSLTRSFFPTNFLSNPNTLYLPWYMPSNCWSCSYWNVA